MKGEKANCAYCGKEFIKKSNRSICCSNSCRVNIWNREHRVTHKKVCAICGKDFETTDSKVKYCSKACAQRAIDRKKRESMQRVAAALPPIKCVECGREFVPSSKLVRVCSPECRSARLSRVVKHLEPKACAICGKVFTPKSSSAKYCSDECRKEAVRRKNTKSIEPAPASPVSETSPLPKREAKLNAAARRWAKMSWDELSKENEYYGMWYKESQIRAYAGTLPEDYGLKRKKGKKYEENKS